MTLTPFRGEQTFVLIFLKQLLNFFMGSQMGVNNVLFASLSVLNDINAAK